MFHVTLFWLSSKMTRPCLCSEVESCFKKSVNHFRVYFVRLMHFIGLGNTRSSCLKNQCSNNCFDHSADVQNLPCDNYFPGLRSHRYSVIPIQIQRFLRFQWCSELCQSTLILTYLVLTDSVMNISKHLWFSAEHYWQAANRQRPWKQPKKLFFLQYWCWRDEKSKISE